MALHFYFGGSGSGKSHAVFRHMIDASIEEPDSRFLILVPEQSTMETQRQIVRLHPRGGILNIDVLSMTRLAHRVFAEVGCRKEEMLEEINKQRQQGLEYDEAVLKAFGEVTSRG